MRRRSLKSIVSDAYKDENNIETFKLFSKEEVLNVVSTVMNEVRYTLADGIHVYIPELGSLRIRHPASKIKVCSISKTGVCRKYPRVVFKSNFRVKENEDED